MNNSNNSNNSSSINNRSIRRQGVEHSYHDYANVSVADASMLFQSTYYGGGVTMRQQNPLAQGAQQQGFAVKLHYMLDDIERRGEESIVSWQPHGRCFLVHDRDTFVRRVLPSYFLQSTFASFQRQLNLYGFKRISSGQDKGGYYHELFLRMKPQLTCFIQRIKRKGQGPRKPDSPEAEPDLYSIPFLPRRSSTSSSQTGVLTKEQALLQQPLQQTPQAVQASFRPNQQQERQQSGKTVNQNATLSLRNLLPASLGNGQFAGQQGPQAQQQHHHYQNTMNPYDSFCQPQPLLPSSELAASFQRQLQATLHLSDGVARQLEPTPINPSSSCIHPGAPQVCPFAPLSSAPDAASTISTSTSSQGNNNGQSNNPSPLDQPQSLWMGPVQALPRNGNSSDSRNVDVNINYGVPGDLSTNDWQAMFSNEDEMWSNHLGV